MSPLANVIPSPVQTVVTMTEFENPNLLVQTLATAAQALGRDDIAALKEAASFLHQCPADVRLPLVPAEPETIIRIRHAYAQFARSKAADLHAA